MAKRNCQAWSRKCVLVHGYPVIGAWGLSNTYRKDTAIITKEEAVKRLKRRFVEQLLAYPLTALIPESLYVARNVRHVMKNDLLKAYADEQEWK